MASPFQRAYPPAAPAVGPAFWFPFRGSELVVQKNEEKIEHHLFILSFLCHNS